MAGRVRRWLTGLVVLACAAMLLIAAGPASGHGSDSFAADTGIDAGNGTNGFHERFITDAQGRALILYGLNTAASAETSADGTPAIAKSYPKQESSLLGTDFVRYLIQWRKVEPERGVFDTKYLAQVEQQISWYRKAGYQVLLDMHQDVYGPAVGGDGAPAWATDSGGLKAEPQQDGGRPSLSTYIQPGVTHAYDEFWGTLPDHPEYQQEYVRAWTAVAKYFAHDKAVLGFDLMNEPWGGSVQGPEFEAGPLAGLYQRTIDAIRTVDPATWLFVEPEATTANWSLPSALPKLDDPRSGGARIVYAPHLYPEPIDTGGSYTGGNTFLTDRSLASWQSQTERTAARMDAPVFLGAWGLDATQLGAHLYVDHVQQLIDTMMIGQAYWSSDPGNWSPWEKQGKAADIADVLATAYPRAIAGQPVSFGYDKSTWDLNVKWTLKKGVTGSTDVYLPEGDFPFGGTVEVADGVEYKTSWDAKLRVLSVTVDPKSVPQDGTAVIDMDITPSQTAS